MYQVIGTVRTRSQRVFWALEEMGLAYELIEAAPRSEAAFAVNPTGKVPALRDGADVITDSTAILTYLADKHDLLTAPAGSIARAQQDAVTQFLICEMDAQLWTAAKHSFVLPPEQRLPEIKKTVAWEFAQTMRQLAEILGDKPFLMGEALTIPDIIAGQCGAWAQMAKLDLGSERVVDYIARLTARPAYQAASGA